MTTSNAITATAERVDAPFGRLGGEFGPDAIVTPAAVYTGIGTPALATLGGGAATPLTPGIEVGGNASVAELVAARSSALRA
ncbi:hypothetical protein CFN78_18295 [Amycolatopsis antarctica]|uniref:Uncharacterized protein n=1 Tax=Amycolatopsis antarctica TaxID=1854586 RepID=A0A263D018_9PSEU|nr:hypothetical protein [Amycolatopsis antarctica]OZM71780.1 hypothetical protein CFN78_18295 [Amycolatopsis antarctica]